MTPKSYATAVCLLVYALMTLARAEPSVHTRGEVVRGAQSMTDRARPMLPIDIPERSWSTAKLSSFAWPPQNSCSDSIVNCKDPVKYLGSQGDCACFACEYATAAQHSVCTNVAADKETLSRRAR